MIRESRGRVPIAKEYQDVATFNEDTTSVFAGENTGMYQRYDYKELASDEKNFAEMMDVPDTAIFNSGMAAIHTAVEAEELEADDVVLCSQEIYGVTKDYVVSLAERGIKVQFFDPGDIDALRDLARQKRPRLIIAETVSSSKEMKMIDLPALAEVVETTAARYAQELSPGLILQKRLKSYLNQKGIDKEPTDTLIREMEGAIDSFKHGNQKALIGVLEKMVAELGISRAEANKWLWHKVQTIKLSARKKISIILDNTLPSPILINPVKFMGEANSDMIVVESGTKHYQGGNNRITMGIVYSKDAARVKKVKNLRIQTGSYLQSTSEVEIPHDITDLMPEIVKKHSENAMRLAKILEEKGFTVYHPNLESHPQNKLANKIAPDGAVTLFYVDVPEEIASRDEFMDRVKKIGGDSIGLGSSFGHKKTWLSNFSLGERTIRIAVGSESSEEFAKVERAFTEASK